MKAEVILLLALMGGAHAQTPERDVDVMHLNDGAVLRGRVMRLASKSIAMQVQLPGGIGSANREIATANLKFIDFAPLPGEAKALANPTSVTNRKRLLELWQEKSVNLRWPTNNAGSIGLAYGGELMKMKDPDLWQRALNVFALIEKEDWDVSRRNAAKKGRLHCLIKLKRTAEAMDEARDLAGKSEDPELLLEASLVIAEADFEKLKTFQADHPRWMDDDELMVERMSLYHRVLDEFLRVPLFHGSVEDKASFALWRVAEVHRFAGENDAAAQRARDLLELYPNAAEAAQALLIASPKPGPEAPEPPAKP